MAGYFDYLGRVFTERGAWYKVVTMIVLSALSFVFAPSFMITSNGPATMPNFNVPGLILYFLVAILLNGYWLQVFHDRMNDETKIVPGIDFAQMLLNFVKAIPFGLVWVLYYIGGCFLMGFLGGFLSKISFVLGLIVLVPALCYIVAFSLTMQVMLAIFSQKFSYKHVLNPFLPFALFFKVAGWVFLTNLLTGLLTGLAAIICVGPIMIISPSIMQNGLAGLEGANIAIFVIVAFIFFYLVMCLNLAFVSRICDITREKLEDTEYLTDNYRPTATVAPAPADDDGNDGLIHDASSDDSLDF